MNVSILLVFAIISQAFASCVIDTFLSVENVTASCTDILFNDLYVPAGVTLDLNLLNGTTVTFAGNITFGFVNWAGPLVHISGTEITIQGVDGHILNGQGELYWDSLGSWGTQKPKFISINETNTGLFQNLHLYHAPMHGIFINTSSDLILRNVLIDNAAGAQNVAPEGKAGHNTDGFGVHLSTNVTIRDSTVYNQDDCVALNSGSNLHVTNMLCHGSHGLSISVGFSNYSVPYNTLTNVLIENSTIIDAMDGIHIKTHIDAGVGEVTNVTYRNIVIIGSYSYGISIEQNYTNTNVAGAGAIPLNNIPIKELKFSNIKGVVQSNAIPYYIICAVDGCSEWYWENVDVYGTTDSVCVNLHPEGISCIDYYI